MLTSVILYTVQTVIVIRGIIEGGIGQHASKIDIVEATKGFQTWYLGELIYAMLSCLFKTSVVLFFQEAYIGRSKIRKATNRRKICWILYICLAVIWATSIVFLSASIFQ
ncbi:P-type ATPase [Fusarium coicis]|nr:P-type ATPase [Fusarium coicis]